MRELHIDHIVIIYILTPRYILYIHTVIHSIDIHSIYIHSIYIVMLLYYVTISYYVALHISVVEDELESRLLVHLRAVGRPLAALGLAASLSLDG